MTNTDVALMEENMPADLSKLTDEELRKLTGQDDNPRMPRLSINHDAETEAGKTLPRGHYAINDPSQDNVKIYGKTAIIRPFFVMYQYSVWDNDERKFTKNSVMAPSFSHRFFDSVGGEKCGKMPWAQAQDLDKDSPEAIKQKGIKCNVVVYGLVSITDGKTADGKKTSCKDVPCVWYAKGSSFKGVSDFFNAQRKQNKVLIKTEAKLETVRQTGGGNTYYYAEITGGNDVDLQPEDTNTMQEFMNIIKDFNSSVMEKYDRARANEVTDIEIDLEADLADDTP